LDITEKIKLVEKPPTEEIVTKDELIDLFKTNSHPKHYIGLEISGFLHLGSLLSIGYKINDFIKAGIGCTVFLADWHTVINDKLGGEWDTISRVSKYYEDAYKIVCPEVNIVRGSELYENRKEYWAELVRFTKHMSLARTMRTLTIMGRSEKEEKIDLAKLLYPPMQAVDIHFLDVDIAHAGMDQRKIHMLVREVFPKLKWNVPVAIHHKLLPGLTHQSSINDEKSLGKMSKSNPNSTIFIHDNQEEIEFKVNKAWCEEGKIENNPLLEISKQIIFRNYKEVKIERSGKFGGNVNYSDYLQMESDFKNKKLHPTDLKKTVSRLLPPILSNINEKLGLKQEISDLIRKSV